MKRELTLKEKVAENKRLSLSAKGLFLILMDEYPSFACYYKAMKHYCNESDKEILSALTELVAFGYISKDYLTCYIDESANEQE